MPTANELLRSVASQPNPEGHIVVGGDRFITVPSNLKRLGVQHDHNIETVTFDCPKKWDGEDMSKMAIYIVYSRAGSEGGIHTNRYPVSIPVDQDPNGIGNTTVIDVDNDNIMHFDWTISRDVTEVAGPISFMVCITKVDTEGSEKIHWNSEICTECYISPGMESEEYSVDENYDAVTSFLQTLVEKIKADMESMVDNARQSADEAQTYSLATEDTLSEAEMVLDEINDKSDYIKNSYASAIKGNVSGEVIRVDDVSPIEHDVKCRVHGKNRIDLSKFVTTGPYTDFAYVSSVSADELVITSTANDSGYCGTGTTVREACGDLTIGKGYVLTAVSSSGRNFAYLNGANVRWDFGSELVMTDLILDSTIVFYGLMDDAGETTISNVQIEEGPVATQYEPYIDTTSITVQSRSKNLIDTSLMKTTSTLNGVTITRKGNVLSFNGTLTTDSVLFNTHFCFHAGMNNNYTLSYKYISGGINGTASLCIGDGNTIEESRQSWANIMLKHTNNQYTVKTIKPYVKDLWFYAVKGVVFSDYQIEIQLEYGNSVTNYGTYSESVASLDSYGTCKVTSKYPTMTLFTDTPGITIEAEYNVDTAKMFEHCALTDEVKQEIADLVDKPSATISNNILIIK